MNACHTATEVSVKQLVAEIKNLREELAEIKNDVMSLKKSLEPEKQVVFIKYRKWDPSVDED